MSWTITGNPVALCDTQHAGKEIVTRPMSEYFANDPECHDLLRGQNECVTNLVLRQSTAMLGSAVTHCCTHGACRASGGVFIYTSCRCWPIVFNANIGTLDIGIKHWSSCSLITAANLQLCWRDWRLSRRIAVNTVVNWRRARRGCISVNTVVSWRRARRGCIPAQQLNQWWRQAWARGGSLLSPPKILPSPPSQMVQGILLAS